MCLTINGRYNSAIFNALGTNEYSVLLAPEDFDFKNPPNYESVSESCVEDSAGKNIADFYSQASNFQRLNYTECIKHYAADFITDRGILILVTKDLTVSNESLRWIAMGNNRDSYMKDPFSWMCADLDATTSKPEYENCMQGHRNDLAVISMPWSYPLLNVTTPSRTLSTTTAYYHDYTTLYDFLKTLPQEKELQQYLNDPSHWENSTWAKNVTVHPIGTNCAKKQASYSGRPSYSLGNPQPKMPVDHCWSEKIEEKCQLLFSLPICLAVIGCNTVKVICMFLAAFDSQREILLTVGDAISSFLSNPEDRKGPRSWQRSLTKGELPANQSAQTIRKKKRWIKSESALNWIWTIMLYVHSTILFPEESTPNLYSCLGLLSTAGFLLNLGISALDEKYSNISFSTLWNLGFGTASSSTTIKLCGKGNCPQVIPIVLLANLPQALVSIAYFLYNKILTKMLLTAEYNVYAKHCKPLRVSWPKGLQRSTYYLSLPYRYSLPLLVAHTALHWLISQSLFLVEVILYDSHGIPIPTARLVTCGFSPIAIIFSIALFSVMICTFLGLGLKQFKTSIHLAGSRSIAISAACHPPPGGNDALKPVMWGEIPKEQLDPEAVSEEEPLRSTSSLGTGNHASDGDLGQYSNQRQENESQTRLLTEENGPVGGEDDTGYKPHCSFSSLEVITLKS